VAGHDIGRLHASQVPYYRRQIGVVFQDHQLLSDRNIFHNVALPLMIQGVTPREQARRVRAALDKVGLLHREKALPIERSGGGAAARGHRACGGQQASLAAGG
jgi:cell division transport system ATP-binding protein